MGTKKDEMIQLITNPKQYKEIESLLRRITENIHRPNVDGNGYLDKEANAKRLKDFLSNVQRLNELAIEIGNQTIPRSLNATSDRAMVEEARKMSYAKLLRRRSS